MSLFEFILSLYRGALQEIFSVGQLSPQLQLKKIMTIFDFEVKFSPSHPNGGYDIGPNEISPFLDVLPTLIRLSISIIFVGSFFLQPLQRPIMAIWARVVESDRPVFTVLFGGIAGFARAVMEIMKHL
jgi:hypothetical protein